MTRNAVIRLCLTYFRCDGDNAATGDESSLCNYFPQSRAVSQADLNKVALGLNQRPRKTLGFETPASRLQASVASTS